MSWEVSIFILALVYDSSSMNPSIGKRIRRPLVEVLRLCSTEEKRYHADRRTLTGFGNNRITGARPVAFYFYGFDNQVSNIAYAYNNVISGTRPGESVTCCIE
jgi:hypothetical protein